MLLLKKGGKKILALIVKKECLSNFLKRLENMKTNSSIS